MLAKEIILRYLKRKRAEKFRKIVEEYSKTKEGIKWKKRFRKWNEIIDTEKSYLLKLIFVIQVFKFFFFLVFKLLKNK